ncbi:MAG: lysophospholipid acyltransferase family protein [Bauldia sp.]
MVPSNPRRSSRPSKPELPVPVNEDDGEPLARGRRGNVSLGARFKYSEFGENFLANAFAVGLRFVNATNRLTFDPVTSEEIFARHSPFIATVWHGQAFMLPFMRPAAEPADVLVSRNSDADLIANLLTRLGCGIIRGSGVHDPARMFEKGAVAGFRAMKTSLDEGRTVAATADFLRHARRKVSPGIVTLARVSGRPIVPTAFASSRRYEMSSWDSITISLPFGRTACVFAPAITVPANADDALLEAKRLEVENALNAATERAYAIVDKRRG